MPVRDRTGCVNTDIFVLPGANAAHALQDGFSAEKAPFPRISLLYVSDRPAPAYDRSPITAELKVYRCNSNACTTPEAKLEENSGSWNSVRQKRTRFEIHDVEFR